MPGTATDVALDLDVLAALLRADGHEVQGDLVADRVGRGQSNLTYLVRDEHDARWIVRRPPRGELLASAHDVLREHRILAALSDTDVPVPQVLGRYVDGALAEETLRQVIAAAGDGPVVVHCCAAGVPFGLLRRAGAAAVSFDAGLLTERDDEAIGEAVEGGLALFAGVVPATGVTPAALSDPAGTVRGVRTLWRRLGLSLERLADTVAITPACGLAGASPAYARAALGHCVRAARSLADDPE